MNSFSWKTNFDDAKNLEKTFRESELSKIAQSWKEYLAKLTQFVK